MFTLSSWALLLSDAKNKRIYEYEEAGEKATVSITSNISPYLVEGPDRAIVNRASPLCDVPEIGIGNKPIDDGNYLFAPKEKAEFLKREPAAREFFRRWVGSEEFINGIERWCLWLGDCTLAKLREMPRALERVEAVRKFRLASKSAPTRAIADKPTRFHVENMPAAKFLTIPKVSSERRKYIPMGFMSAQDAGQRLVLHHTRRYALPLRHPRLGNAHGLGAAGWRTVGVALPLFGQADLQ